MFHGMSLVTLLIGILLHLSSYSRQWSCFVGCARCSSSLVPSCGLQPNELEESFMVITAESIWHLGRAEPFKPAELYFYSPASQGESPVIKTPESAAGKPNNIYGSYCDGVKRKKKKRTPAAVDFSFKCNLKDLLELWLLWVHVCVLFLWGAGQAMWFEVQSALGSARFALISDKQS